MFNECFDRIKFQMCSGLLNGFINHIIASIFGIVHCEHLKFRNIVLQKSKYRKLLFSQIFLDLCFLATEYYIFEFSPGTTSAA